MVVEGREGLQWQMRVGRARIVSVWSRREVSNPKTILFLLQRTRCKSPVRRITLDSNRLTAILRAVRCQRRRVLVRITLTAPANLESTQPWRILEILLICARHDFRRNGDSGQFKKKARISYVEKNTMMVESDTEWLKVFFPSIRSSKTAERRTKREARRWTAETKLEW